jgi:hypothetical protein
MPEYSSKQTAGDIVVSAQLDTTTNTITYTLTGPNGLTTTATQQATAANTPSSPVNASTATLRTLLGPFREAGVPGSALLAVSTTLRDVTVDVNREASNAAAAATATKTPVPENPAPPPSTNNQADPAVAPAPNNTPPVQNAAPATTSSPANLAQNAATTNEAAQDKKLPVEPNLAQNAATTNEAAQDKKLPVEPNLAQNAATTNEAIQDKKPTEIDELSAYPPNTVAQQSAEADELSAYPPYTQVGRTLGGAHVDNATPVKISGDPPIDRKMADADYTNNLIPTSGERGPNVGFESNKTALRNAQAAQTEQTAQKFKAQEDWRVRLSLAPGATYLYKVGQGAAGILNPLQATDGVIFPYTPAISVTYNAGYDATDVTHSNYK